MPTRYKYKALDDTGKFQQGVVIAETPEQVVDQLNSHELVPVSVSKCSERNALSLLGFIRGTDYDNLILFTNNLSTMYRSGIPLLRALSIIKIGPEGSRFNQAIQQIRFSVQSGKSLSQAMAEYPDLFSKVYLNSIAAGEESGKLEEILDEMSSMLEKEMEISRLLKSGLRYPMIVISVIILGFVVLMTYVIPKFVAFYSSFHAQLPLPTRVMIALSSLFTTYWPILLISLIAVIFAIKQLLANPKGRLMVDTQLLKLPIFGGLIAKGNVARFSLMFRILFKAGLPIIKCLEILADSVKNSRMTQEIKKIEDIFKRGAESELSTEQFTFFPDMARQMIAIGLESGSLENMLDEVGTHYSKEVQYTSRQLTAILEPILTLVVSVFVLMMALAIFLPMWNLIKVFNGG
ncbi:MAG TPA: type II secretion system F family protein [candidate division Zixibacteria bacterium]|nr:type II secretion system F family protein [candidate division Zixibacteria bacterium]